MKPLSFFLSLSVSFVMVGCSDPLLETTPTAPAPQQTTVGVDLNPTAAVVAPPDGVAPLPSAQTNENNAFPEAFATEQTLHTLNMFLIEYQASGGQIPATIEEMVAKKIIPKIPPAPTGKRFEVDQQKAMVTFADK
ncbi:MAG: hypothetical protein ACO1QS_21090 [Verrucomicrobiota bacterium]